MNNLVVQGRRSLSWLALLAVLSSVSLMAMSGCGKKEEASTAGAPPTNAQDNAEYQKMQQQKK